ncbi:MAG: sulfurtransferase complex subunit TusD [Pseudomonadota bacterium]
MRFAILVNESPYQHQSSDTAYHFTKAALEAGHEVVRVFFYHDGVYNGNRLNVPPQDERDVGGGWADLQDRFGVELTVCVAAAQRRGMLDADEMRRNERDSENLRSSFSIAGLGQLIEATIIADRLLVFGD